MWWRKEKAKPPFTGSSFDAALNWCQANNEQIEVKSPDAFDVFLGSHVVHVERFIDDDWLHAWAILPEAPITTSSNIVKNYERLAARQFGNLDVIMDFDCEEKIVARFLKLTRYQGNQYLMVFNMLSTFDFLLNGSEMHLYPPESCFFYVDGKKFTNSSKAAIYYFSNILKLKQIEENEHYSSFETGGLVCAISRKTIDQEFLFRYGFTDFEKCYGDVNSALSSQFICAAYRKINLKIMSYLFKDGISEMAISGVLTEGTEAMPIFDRTLAELTQVVLDSMELIKMNPGLVKGTQFLTSEQEAIELASKYHGDKTGGAENLVE